MSRRVTLQGPGGRQPRDTATDNENAPTGRHQRPAKGTFGNCVMWPDTTRLRV